MVYEKKRLVTSGLGCALYIVSQSVNRTIQINVFRLNIDIIMKHAVTTISEYVCTAYFERLTVTFYKVILYQSYRRSKVVLKVESGMAS